MTVKSNSQSSGTGQQVVRPDSAEGVASLLSHFPNVPLGKIRAWVSLFRQLDLGGMDLSQWPPRPVSSTVIPVGSRSDK
jgi:hypothetical protein